MILLKLTGSWSGEPYWQKMEAITGLCGADVPCKNAHDTANTTEPGTRIDLIGGSVGSDGDIDANHIFVRELPEVVLDMMKAAGMALALDSSLVHIIEPHGISDGGVPRG